MPVFRVNGGKILMAPQVLQPVLLRLTLGFGASLPLGLTENPSVAHIPASNYTGYVVMYSTDRTMTISGQSDNYQVQKSGMPTV